MLSLDLGNEQFWKGMANGYNCKVESNIRINNFFNTYWQDECKFL